MKLKVGIAVGIAAIAVTSFFMVGNSLAADAPWFDMQKCAACAPYMAEAGLMSHVQMEYHTVATGMLSLTTVPAEYEAALERAHAKCNQVIASAQGGEKVYLCNMCLDLMGLAASGAKIDQFQTSNGYVMAATSTDPALIKKLQAHAERTTTEMMKMSQATK